MTNIDFETEKQAMRRMKQIDDEINMDYMLGIQELTDIENVYCNDSNLGRTMRKNIILKFAKQGKKLNERQIDELLHGGNIKISREALLPYFRDKIVAEAQHIDWDKFLLLSAYRAKRLLTSTSNTNMTPEKADLLRKIMKAAQKLLIDTNIHISTTIDTEAGNKVAISYSYNELVNDITNPMTQNQEDIQLQKWKAEISKTMHGTEGR